MTTGEDGDGQNRCWCWSRSAETCHCLKAAQSCVLWKDTLKEGWFPWSGAAAGSQSAREGCCVVLTHPAWLWAGSWGWSPPQHPPCVPSACHQTKAKQCGRLGSPHPATAGSKPRLWVLSTLRLVPGSPKLHSKFPPGHNDTFQQDEVSPVSGSSQSPVAFGGKSSTLPGALGNHATCAGALALTLSPSQPFPAPAACPAVSAQLPPSLSE